MLLSFHYTFGLGLFLVALDDAAAPVWQLAVVAVVAVVCSVMLLAMCLCCKRAPGFKVRQ